MKTQIIFNQIAAVQTKHVKNFTSDFDHDKKSMDKHKLKFDFLHIARTNGTTLIYFKDRNFYADAIKEYNKVNSLPNVNSINDLIKGNKVCFDHYINNDVKNIIFFDAKKGTIRNIKRDTAIKLFAKYYNKNISS
jgi:hypothetical protein